MIHGLYAAPTNNLTFPVLGTQEGSGTGAGARGICHCCALLMASRTGQPLQQQRPAEMMSPHFFFLSPDRDRSSRYRGNMLKVLCSLKYHHRWEAQSTLMTLQHQLHTCQAVRVSLSGTFYTVRNNWEGSISPSGPWASFAR